MAGPALRGAIISLRMTAPSSLGGTVGSEGQQDARERGVLWWTTGSLPSDMSRIVLGTSLNVVIIKRLRITLVTHFPTLD